MGKLFMIFSAVILTYMGSPDIEPARASIERVCQTSVQNMTLKSIDKVDGKDVYEFSATGGKLTVSGSSPSAICRGFYDYLRENKLGMVGWEGARVTLPQTWPDTAKKRVVTPFKIRHCYNVVTAGYTFPYWTWERWEQELDWLAMHGFNMIMTPVATEAIATRVWTDLGLTQDEIDKFYTGPAHLPWQRMGNIQAVDGTLSAEWHTGQIALQKKILARMRELGIEPVVQSFAGFVPPDITRIYPNVELHTTDWPVGLAANQKPVVMMPDNPLFKTISSKFITEWEKEFGDARYYLVDSFNEMSLPDTGTPVTEQLANYGENTYDAIKAGDSDAIWVIQGWMFTYQRHIWNTETVEALLSKVPNDKMFVLDYATDYSAVYGIDHNWKTFNGFHGKPWAMGYVPNMGGKTGYTGNMEYYAGAVETLLNDAGKNNNVGFTISGEALENNQVLYELMSDTAWSETAIVLDDWLKTYSENRYGSYPVEVKTCWDKLRATCYSYLTDHPRFGWQLMQANHGSMSRDSQLTEGVLSFLSVNGTFTNSQSYIDDAVEMASISLGLKADEWFLLARQAHDASDYAVRDQASARGLEILLEIDKLLESHSLNRLDRWIDLARQHSTTTSEQDRYERNAKRILTVWETSSLNDYSARIWSGLIRDFYQPRMAAFFDGLKTGSGFDKTTWQENWVSSIGVSQISPYADPAAKALELVTNAYNETMPIITNPVVGETIGYWSPATVSTEWQTLEWTITTEQLAALKGVQFTYQSGAHRLDIQWAQVVADGTVVAEEVHDGYAGVPSSNNIYLLTVPEGTNGNNGCLIRASVRSDGGTDSNGAVQLIVE